MSRKLFCFRKGFLLAMVSACFLFPRAASAQINSTLANVTLEATSLEVITLAAVPGLVTFELSSQSTSNGSTPVAITTGWVLNLTRTSVSVYAYFDDSTAALSDLAVPPHKIPAANVLGQASTGLPTALTGFTQTGPFGSAGGSLKLFAEGITLTNAIKTRVDNLTLQLNLSGLSSLPAGIYTGVLHIQAQAL